MQCTYNLGTGHPVRTPGIWLSAHESKLHTQFTGNWYNFAGLEISDGLLLNKWYHIAYTLSDPEKRLDIYVNGEWVGFYSIKNVKTEKVAFNDGPLHVGRAHTHIGFNGEIRFD
jgi:hypothetical protein